MYGTEHNNAGTIALGLSLPLFKSFNASVLANNIRAAEETYRQLEYELSDTVCQTLLSASSAYWAYLTAHSTMRNLEEIQRILKERANGMDRLIKSGVRSRNDMLSMQVNEIENERNVVSARMAYENARLALVQALEERLSAAESTLRMATANARPDAALNFSVGSTGAVYGDSFSDYLNSFVKNVPGANISGGLSFSMSLPNNANTGRVESAQAAVRQAQVQLAQAKNTLYLQIASTVSKLHAYRTLVVQANDALSLQKQLYVNEQHRFESGLITIDDMSNQDTKYLDAQSKYYNVMITYLQTVLEYKYYTGTLVALTEEGQNTLSKNLLYAF